MTGPTPTSPRSAAATAVVPLLRLATGDNVAVAARSLVAGTTVELDTGVTVTLREAIGVGHKVAIRRIAAGEKVIKWGCPIGSATRGIAAGEHVHVQNLRSDYLPTFTTATEDPS